MRGIFQYEVYVFDAGRWSLHSRYPGAQRLDAMNDAVTTEQITGHPAKVVRDTYYPEDNRNEEITAYLGPKAKRMQALDSRAEGVDARRRPGARRRAGANRGDASLAATPARPEIHAPAFDRTLDRGNRLGADCRDRHHGGDVPGHRQTA